jgi:outer membrane lipoprotein-sorting protein
MNRPVLIALLVLFTGRLMAADDPRAIVAEVQKRSRAESQQYEGVLKVVDAAGKTSEKGWQYERLGSHGDSKLVIRFMRPAEVKGVALLVLNHPDRSSDQWMWTPAINRERRVAAQDRGSRFFGTDFSFEDLEERDVEQYEYQLAGEVACEGEPCWQITATPRSGKRSQYTKSVYSIRKSTYTYAQVENHNVAGLVRRVKYSQMANVQGIWTARTLEVEDVVRKSRTTLSLQSVKYNVPLAADQFTVEALRRGF